MFKLIGVILFISGSTFFVFLYDKEEKAKIKKCENLFRLLYLVNMNILEKKRVLPDAFFDVKGCISEYIDKFLEMCEKDKRENYNARENMINLMKRYFKDTNEELLENIVSYISILGTTDKKTSLENFNLISKDCENIIFNIKEAYKKNIKLTRTMTYAIASVTVLILI